MCTYVRTFVQSEIVIAQFLEALGTILTKNLGLTWKWLLMRARLWHTRVVLRIFPENSYFQENFENGEKFWAKGNEHARFCSLYHMWTSVGLFAFLQTHSLTHSISVYVALGVLCGPLTTTIYLVIWSVGALIIGTRQSGDSLASVFQKCTLSLSKTGQNSK